MRKKLLIFMMMGCMAMGTMGCAMSGTAVSETTENTKDEEKKKEDNEKDAGKETEENENDQGIQENPVLGDEGADYSAYEYLYCETIKAKMIGKNGSSQNETVNLDVLIPISDIAYADDERAFGNKMGVRVTTTLNPYIQLNQEDYLMSENLEAQLEADFNEFNVANYCDIEISSIEEFSDECARVSVSYVQYDEWYDKYKAFERTYFLTKLDEERTLMVEVEIVYDEVTGKTEKLIEEIESFYGFNVAYDKKDAAKRLEAYTGKMGDKRMISTGYMTFELPAHWESDWDYTDDAVNKAYAPDGDGYAAESVIIISRNYYGNNENIQTLMADTAVSKELIEENIACTVNNFVQTNINDTAIGNGVKLNFEVMDEGKLYKYVIYYIQNGEYMYNIQAINSEGSEDAIALVDEIVQSAKVKEGY